MRKFKYLIILITLYITISKAENSNPLCENLYIYMDTVLVEYLDKARSRKPNSIDLYYLWDEQVKTLNDIKTQLKTNKPFIQNEGALALASLTRVFSQRLISLLALAPGKAGKSIAAAQGTVLKVIDQYKGKISTKNTLNQAYEKVKPLSKLGKSNALIIDIFKGSADLIHGLETVNQDLKDLKNYKSTLSNQINNIEKQIQKAKQKRALYLWSVDSIIDYQNWIVEYCKPTSVKK